MPPGEILHHFPEKYTHPMKLLKPAWQCSFTPMRLITRQELPSDVFFVKSTNDYFWRTSRVDPQMLDNVVMHVGEDHLGISTPLILQDAVDQGWQWNIEKRDEGANKFYIEEGSDVDLRKKTRDFGDKPFTIVFKDQTKVRCTLSPVSVSPAITHIFDETVVLVVDEERRKGPIFHRWYNIEDITT